MLFIYLFIYDFHRIVM